jgi:hypothetical protein
MTFIKETSYKIAKGDLNVYYNASATIGQDQPVSWANLDSNFSNNFSMTKNGGQFNIPNDNKTYVLEATLTNNTHLADEDNFSSYMTYQWYDVTNSQYVGIKGYIAGSYNYNEGRTSGTVADEKALFVTNQNNIYELRILTAVGLSDVDETNTGGYSGRARCCIWRF